MVRTTRLTAWHLLLGVLLAAGPVYAQDDAGAITTDRPDFGAGAALVAPGRFQVEAGYAFAWTDTTRRHSLGQVLLRAGLTPRVELRVALNSFVVLMQDSVCSVEGEACFRPGTGRSEGIEDLAIGAKVNLVQSQRIGKPTLTAVVGFGVPTGHVAFSADALHPEVRLALDLALSPLIQFSGNGGYTFTLENDGLDDFFTSAVFSTTFPRIKGLGAFAGVYSFYPRNFEFTHVLEGGMTYQPYPALQFDLNLSVGLKGDGPDFGFGVGAARRF